MLSYYFQGLALGAAMILPLGPQNAFVMNQGIRRQYHLMIALLCAVSDLLLICAGIFGGSALLMQSPWLLALVTGRRGVSALVRIRRAENGNEQQPRTGERGGHEAGALEDYRHHAGGDRLTRMYISTPSSCWAARAVNWTLSRNAGLRSVRSAPLSCGSSVSPFWRHGWHPPAYG